MLYSFMDRLLPQNIRIKPRWTKGYASWSIIAYGMNKRAMERYIQIVDAQPMIADSITYHMMSHENYNFYIASPPLLLPSKELSSNIRGRKNYETIKSIYILGIDEKDYE